MGSDQFGNLVRAGGIQKLAHFDHFVLLREELIFRPLPLSPPQACKLTEVVGFLCLRLKTLSNIQFEGMRGIMDDLNTSVPPLSSYSGISFQHTLQIIFKLLFSMGRIETILLQG